MEKQPQLTNILKEIVQCIIQEEHLYKKIIHLENQKTRAITERDGENLKQISNQQEHHLTAITNWEQQREKLLHEFNRISSGNFVKISQLLQSGFLDETQTETISIHIENLKDSLLALRNHVALNHDLLKQNQEFFLSLLGELTGQNDSTENPLEESLKKQPRENVRPVFVNTMG